MYKGAATVTADEDAQGLEEPIIAPVKTKTFSKLEKEVRGMLFLLLLLLSFFTSVLSADSRLTHEALWTRFMVYKQRDEAWKTARIVLEWRMIGMVLVWRDRRVGSV